MNQQINTDRQNHSNAQKHWETTDLSCASTLVSLNFSLLSINKENPRRGVFIFEKTPELSDAVNNYFSDKLLINPRKFFDNIKLVKSRLYS